MSWKKLKLRDIVTLNYGKSLPERVRVEGEVPVYGSGGITGTHNLPLVSGPGIIVGRKGTVGAVYWESRAFYPIDTVYYAEPAHDEVHKRYLYYLLNHLPLASMNSDAAVPGLNRDNAYALDVTLPDFATQRRIASILSAYDDLIENNRRRIALLEQAARLLYREWFVHFRFPGHETTKIIDGLPEGWRCAPVQDLGRVITGKTPSKKIATNFNGSIPFIKTPDMHGNIFVLTSQETLTEQGAKSQPTKTIPAGSILVSCIGTVGVVAMTSSNAQFNQQINAVVPDEEISPIYCYFTLSALKPRLEAIGGGATMANVNKTKFENLSVCMPPRDVQRVFQLATEPQFELIHKLSLQNAQLTRVRDLLLPRLMDGRIPV